MIFLISYGQRTLFLWRHKIENKNSNLSYNVESRERFITDSLIKGKVRYKLQEDER